MAEIKPEIYCQMVSQLFNLGSIFLKMLYSDDKNSTI